MRINTKNIIILLVATLGLSGCNKNFLDREPLDQFSTTGSLSTANEVRLYMNQFYNNLPVQPYNPGGVGVAFDDGRTDNMIFTSVDSRLNGQLTVSGATSLSEYTQIRNINFLLRQVSHVNNGDAVFKSYIGEAYFFRAWFYFELLKKYGDVTWVNTLLSADDESTFLARDSRLVIVDSILADLDKATSLLSIQSDNYSMRVHKDIALAFKSRVALYESTWQRYHKAKNTPFYSPQVTDQKIISYLTEARDAAKEVIDGNRWEISNTGKPYDDYRELFNTIDLSGNPEVLMYRRYKANEGIGHSVSKYLSTGGGDIGVTQSLISDYLTRDGKPLVGAGKLQLQSVYGNDLLTTERDPRLAQTVVVPGAPLRPDANAELFPPINQTGFVRSTTGYPLYKYVEYNNLAAASDDGNSSAPVIYFRYAEVLLNYAEALAELNESEASIVAALRPIRQRVDMPDVDFVREYNTDASYPFASLNKVIQAVRRERRVEMVAEGQRLQDIFRWASADVLVAHKRPLGILFIGSNIAAENSNTGFYQGSLLYYDTAPTGKSINFYLTGTSTDSYRYMDPYKEVLPTGYGFRLDRDYLLPIQLRMLELTNNKWVQNPNW